MSIIETACYALAFVGLVSLVFALGALAMSSRIAEQERRALIKQLVRFD